MGPHPPRASGRGSGATSCPTSHLPLTNHVALDTLYSLLADADFAKEQELLDAEIVAQRHDVAV